MIFNIASKRRRSEINSLIVCFMVTFLTKICSAYNCNLIRLCPNFDEYAARANSSKLDKTHVADDDEIGTFGNFSGLTPRFYDLHIRFSNLTHFTGKVNISATVVHSTSKVMLNLRVDIVKLQTTDVAIRPDCRRPPKEGTCIQDMFSGKADSVLVIELNNPLPVDSEVEIQFRSFRSSAISQLEGDFSRGLLTADNSSFSATYSYFHMRKARSVFPCFDHLAMKAQFRLTLTYPKEFSVYSTTIPNRNVTSADSDFVKTTTFQTTPVIPISSLSFALTKGYIESIGVISHRDITLIMPGKHHIQLDKFQHLAEAIIGFFETEVGFGKRLTTFQFLVIYSLPVEAVDGFGLTVLKGEGLMGTADEYFGAFFHAIAHQWLGTVVTVQTWSHICLLEGLVTYLEWMYEETVLGRKVADVVEPLMKAARSMDYHSLTNVDFQSDNDMASVCSSLPVLFYHNLAAVSGNKVIEKLASNMVALSNFSTPSMEEWDRQIALASGLNGTLPYYASGHFENAGPVTVFISKYSSYLSISCLYPDSKFLTQSPLFQIYFSSSDTPAVYPNNYAYYYKPVPPDSIWYLVDPERVSVTRKVYESLYYLFIFEHNFYDPNGRLTEKRLQNFAEDFCESLMANLLPQESDFDKDLWLHIFSAAAKYSPSCLRCLKQPEAEWDPCEYNTPDCGSVSVTSQLGFNFPKCLNNDLDDQEVSDLSTNQL